MARPVSSHRSLPRVCVSSQVRFEESLSPQTHLVFCTVGVLLAAMQGSSDLNGVTHIVVDEACALQPSCFAHAHARAHTRPQAPPPGMRATA
eukprot:449075-Pleurochrysis_carterae.AAC.1